MNMSNTGGGTGGVGVTQAPGLASSYSVPIMNTPSRF